MLNFYFDIKSLKKFRDNIEELVSSNRIEEILIDILIEMGDSLRTKTKRRTPVDTGDLKRNWELSDVSKKGDVLEITLSNITEYALYVEYGHRTRDHRKWIKGAYMATISLKEVERDLDKWLDVAMNKIASEVFKGV